jgi:CDP-diglyceride synthetase
MGLEKLFLKAIELLAWLCFCVAVGIVGVLAWFQISDWLKTAVWSRYTVGDAFNDLGISLPHTSEHVGVEKMIDVVANWPGLVVAIAVALIAGLIWIWARERARINSR